MPEERYGAAPASEVGIGLNGKPLPETVMRAAVLKNSESPRRIRRQLPELSSKSSLATF